MIRGNKSTRNQKGFTLIEVAIAILVLVIVMGAVFSQINSVSKTAKRESMTLDMAQENRDFVDLFARDVHMTGYPVAVMYANSPTLTCSPAPSCSKSIAAGIVYASPTLLVLEGDVYGDGTVYSVQYKYYDATDPDPNCPCLRRSAMKKIDANSVTSQSSPVYYTEVQNVIDPTVLNEGIFSYYDAKGNSVNVTGGKTFINDLATIQQIDAIKVNLHVLSTQRDPQTNQQLVNSLSSVAELEN
jgi:prepilin-type N-terminal cleavage/methylation domain-containing protein